MAAAASALKRAKTYKKTQSKTDNAPIASCRLPDRELWEAQYELQMLMLDG